MREPGVGKDTIYTAEDFGHFTDLCLGRERLGAQAESAGEQLGRCQSGGAPIEGVTAVVNGATGLGRFVGGAEVLPFACAHLGTCGSGTGRIIGEETAGHHVCFLSEEATQLVQPDSSVDTRRWLG